MALLRTESEIDGLMEALDDIRLKIKKNGKTTNQITNTLEEIQSDLNFLQSGSGKIMFSMSGDAHSIMVNSCEKLAIRSAQISLEHNMCTILQVNLRLSVYLICVFSYATIHRV